MNNDFEKNLKKLEEYATLYSNYSELDKLEKIFDINNCFDGVIKGIYNNFYNEKLIEEIHNIILTLENLSLLIRFDISVLNSNLGPDYNDILMKDAKLASLFAQKKLMLFMTDGLSYQLTVKDKFLAKPFEYNNPILDKNGKFIVKETINELEWLICEFKHKGLEINPIADLYKKLTVEQLAFIYAQLQYNEYNGLGFNFGSSERDNHDICEKLYDNMRKRNRDEKIKFMEIIYKLGYCNTAMGVCAMVVELLKTNNNESIYKTLNKVIDSCSNGMTDSQEEAYMFLQNSIQIKELRDKDIRNNSKIDTIYNYSLRAPHEIAKRNKF